MLLNEQWTFKKFVVRTFFVLAMMCFVLELIENASMYKIKQEISQKNIQKQLIENQTNTLFIVNFSLKDSIIKQKISDNITDLNKYHCEIKKMNNEFINIQKRFVKLFVIGIASLIFCIFIDYKF